MTTSMNMLALAEHLVHTGAGIEGFSVNKLMVFDQPLCLRQRGMRFIVHNCFPGFPAMHHVVFTPWG
jgi:hypothetical protein